MGHSTPPMSSPAESKYSHTLLSTRSGMKWVCTSTSPGSPTPPQNARTAAPLPLPLKSITPLDLGDVDAVALVPLGPPAPLRLLVLQAPPPGGDGLLVPE